MKLLDEKTTAEIIDAPAILSPEANAGLLENPMARRRYQRGSVVLRGDSWEFRWREDIIENGKLKRICRREAFADKSKYKGVRAASKDAFVVNKQLEINSPTYRALHRSNFREFAARWAKDVLVNLEPSTQSAMRSRLGLPQKDPKRQAKRKFTAVVEVLGELEVKNITAEILQRLVTSYSQQGASPKTVRNIIADMRIMWNTVRAWGYATHDPFNALVFPDPKPVEVPFYGADAMTRVVDVSTEPYRTLFWLTGQTGIRRSEVCALRVCDVVLERNCQQLEQGIVIVKRKVWGSIIGRPKSKRPRVFVLSPKLTERMRELCNDKKPDDLVFTNSKGGMMNPDNLVKRHLKPVLAKAGITEGGMHAFRHGNATLMDQANVPMKIRQDRLGHVDPKTTLGYTHAISEDEKRVAAEFDSVLCPDVSKTENEKAFEGSERLPIQ